MDNVNKVISFILGLVVVVIFIAILSGRIKIGGTTIPFLSHSNPTPTPTPSIKITPTPKITVIYPTAIVSNTNSNSDSYQGGVTSIPSTGPELLFPIAASLFAGGMFLRKKD